MSWSKEATLSESILKLKQFFHPFKYTLDLKAAPQGRHSLEHFLFHQQEGHCEYFATLTTLLLRQMGYLSRYCQGYVITEQDGPWAIARGRDAHAWAEVWDGEDWLKAETTPNANLSLSWTSHFMDPFNQLGFWLDQWRYQDGEDQLLNIAPWGLGVVVIYFFIRLLMEWRQFRERGHQRQLSKVAHDPGFIAIEKLLADKGMGRLPHESWGQWRDRLEQLNPHQPIKAELVEQWNQWAWGDPAFSDQVDFDLKTERRNIKQALRP
jgi:hypothetical protein